MSIFRCIWLGMLCNFENEGPSFYCFSLIKPQITFNASLDNLPFASLMTNYSSTIGPGIQLGKENGLTLLLDAEVYDYAFSPQKGEKLLNCRGSRFGRGVGVAAPSMS